MFEKLKLLFVLVLGALSVLSFYWLSNPIYKVLALSSGLLSAIVLFLLTTSQGQKFFVFLKEVKVELLKVFWPEKSELARGTVSVFFLVFLFSLFLWLVDLFFSWFIAKLLV